MTVIVPQHPRIENPSPIRFGETKRAIHDILTSSDEASDSFLVVSANEEQVPSRISRGKRRVLEGFTVLGVILLGAVVGWIGNNTRSSYEDAKPPEATVILESEMRPDWLTLKQAAIAADADSKNPELRANLTNAAQGMLYRLYFTMKDHPGDLENQQLDAFLAKIVQRSDNFMPDVVGNQIANAFTTYIWDVMEKQQGVENAQEGATRIEIGKAFPFMQQFVNEHPSFDHLSGTEKEALAEELKQIYIEQRAFITPSYFATAFAGSLGTGIEGVSYADIEKVQNRSEAISFFRQVVENGDNFRSLNPEQRDAFLERGTEILNTLDYESPSVLWGAFAWMLLVVGGAASGGLFLYDAFTRRRLMGLFTGAMDVRKGIQNPTLVIHYADKSDPAAERFYGQLESQIQFQAGEIERLMKYSYDNDSQVRGLLLKEFGSEDQLPSAQTFIQRAIYEAKESFMQGRTFKQLVDEEPVAELAFWQKVESILEESLTTGNFLALGLPKGMEKPSEPDVEAAKTPAEALRLQKDLIEFQLREARLFLANRIFAYAEATDALNTQQAKLTKLEDQLLAADGKPDGKAKDAELQTIAEETEHAEKLKGAAERKVGHTEELLLKAKELVGEKIVEMQEFHLQIKEAISRNAFTEGVDDIKRANEQAEAVLEDPDLQRSIEELELQKHIETAAEEHNAARKRAREIIARRVKEASATS